MGKLALPDVSEAAVAPMEIDLAASVLRGLNHFGSKEGASVSLVVARGGQEEVRPCKSDLLLFLRLFFIELVVRYP